MTFARLTRGDWLAAIAALALLLVMAMDWYTTDAGVVARDAEKRIQPHGATAGEIPRAVDEDARIAAEEAEQNAWQADPFPDRVILFALLATVALAVASAGLRAAGVRFEPPWTPSALTTCVGLGTALLLAARIAQKPSANIGAVIKVGAPLGLICVGVVVLAARTSWNAERDGSAWGERRDPGDADHDPFADTDENDAISSKPPPLFDHTMPAGTATAVAPSLADQPATTTEHGEAWAPDWSDRAAPPEPEPQAPDRRRRRGRTRRWRT